MVRTGALTIDLVSRAVTLDGQYITLTRKEYRLLHLLASHLGLVITHNQLIKELWANSSTENIQYLRALVRNLRRKLEADPSQPKLLISVRGRLSPGAPQGCGLLNVVSKLRGAASADLLSADRRFASYAQSGRRHAICRFPHHEGYN